MCIVHPLMHWFVSSNNCTAQLKNECVKECVGRMEKLSKRLMDQLSD